MANPIWFTNNPKLAWGFYGHRLKLYHNTIPHQGFQLLRKMAGHNTSEGYFVFTSNVDEQFQRAGYKKDRIVECHGSIFNLQCVYDYCSVCESKFEGGIASIEDICKANDITIDEWMNALEIDEENTFEIIDNALVPKCLLQQIQGKCPNMKNKSSERNKISGWIWNKKSDNDDESCVEFIARPNILMFGDSGFRTGILMKQYSNFDAWKERIAKKDLKICVIEIGAGSTVARVRNESESAAGSSIVHTFIRINPTDSQISKYIKCKNKISIAANALMAIESIYECWNQL